MSSVTSGWPSVALSVLILACTGSPPEPSVAGEAPPVVTLAEPTSGPGPEESRASATPTATAAPIAPSSDVASHPLADASPRPACGYLPAARVDKSGFATPSNAGCGLAPATLEPHKSVVSIDVVSLALGPRRTVIEVVFLDAQQRRILPIGRKLSFDMRFKHRQRGELRLNKTMHRDGVFEIELRGNARAKPCSSHLYLRLHNGKELLEEWVDDWLYGC